MRGASTIYILFGGPASLGSGLTSWPAEYDIYVGGGGALNGTNGAILTNAPTISGPGYQTKSATATAAGDVNGDGIKDILISSAPTANANVKVYVVLGHANWTANAGIINLTAADGTGLTGSIGFQITGSAAYPPVGSVASGDVNGDGIDDIVIGGWKNANPSYAYVVFGRHNGATTYWETTPGPGVTSYTAGNPNIFSLSAELANNPTASAGTGAASLSSTSTHYGEWLWVGDVNGDGIKDIIADDAVGAGANNLDVYYGRTANWNAANPINAVTAMDGTNGFQLDLGTNVPAWAGTTVLTNLPAVAIGDVNGDGRNDIVIGNAAALPSARAAPGRFW